ncbi:TadA family conjugal transfer-associated ATPase [Jannaschia sp. R86511]|uniref:TadA family conjugal transfer-associated ATPase n=1 Tax=Jannaschia sp. R86511 TaxID=3093853 RepID=UPI0036D3F4CE
MRRPEAALPAGTHAPLGPLGPLEPLLGRGGVTDVLVNGAGRVWVDGEAGLQRVAVTGLDTEEQVRALAVRLAGAGGRRLDDASPWVDARLPDGTRLHAVLPALCRSGTHISLRVPPATALALSDLVAREALSPGLSDALQRLVQARRSLLVTGATGAGKTTLLGALLSCVPAAERVVVVEDAAELAPVHPHVVSLEARPGNVEGAGAVGLDVLVRQALRMRPDRLVVGECRGAEVRELLLAMGAGHAGAATLHAARPHDVPVRVVALAGAAGIDPATALLQLRAAVDVVVPVVRGTDGRRRVEGVWGWADDEGGPAGPAGTGVPRLVPVVDTAGRAVAPGRHGAHATAA